MAEAGKVTLDGVRLVFRNFSGREGEYNREGDRNFGVVIPDLRVAQQMLEDGWNIRYLKPSQEEAEQGLESGPPFLQVKVGRYDRGKPPKIVMVTKSTRRRTPLGEDTIEMLDFADIANVDLIVNPYHYSVRGSTGISAYVQTMFVTIEEDELEAKYSAMDEDQTP